MRNRSLLSICLIVAGLLFTGVSSHAQEKQQSLNKAQAAKKAQQQVNGRVLRVDQQKSKYRVKLLKKSGRVVSVDVDKRSGKVTPQKKKEGY